MVSRYIGGNWCDPELEEPYDEFDYLGIDIDEVCGIIEEPDEEQITYPKELAEEDEEIERIIRQGDLDDR